MIGSQEALQLMNVGARWKVAMPPELAYGMAGNPPAIGPNESILIDVMLHEIVPGGDQ